LRRTLVQNNAAQHCANKLQLSLTTEFK